MRLLKKLVHFISVAIIFASVVNPAKAQGPAPFANCRLGVGDSKSNAVGYNVGQLNMGLYLDWSTKSAPPAGLPANVKYIQVVRVHQNKVGGWNSAYVNPPTYTVKPTLTTLISRVQANPGSLWLIGNEIDRRDWSGGGQDEMTPELYATAFHDLRNVIKTADPTAKIAIGSVIEATPLRLKYLDRVWDSYYNQYGYTMGQDIDVWNIHGFILREVKNSWGADIPVGLNDTSGFLSGASTSAVLAAHHNVAYLQQFTEALRAWMAAHGERNKPLINSEYGVLYKQLGGGQITPQQVSAYLTASFDYMLTATNPTTGYPADENRLVQGWVWYSLNDENWNGNLFSPTTNALTSVGTTWKNYVSDPGKPLASQSRQNLLPANLRVQLPQAYVVPPNKLTAILRVDVANSGNSPTSTGNNLVVKFWGKRANESSFSLISTPTVPDLAGCGGFTTVEVNWSNLGAGDHAWYAEVVPIGNETNVADNIASHTFHIEQGLPVADLKVAKTVDNHTPYEGVSLINYILTVTNLGSDPVTEVVVTDHLPNGVSFDSYTATQGNYYTSGPWLVGTLLGNSSSSLTITARVANGQAGKTITNSASVSSAPRSDSVSNNNASSVNIVPLASKKVYLPTIVNTTP
jgi:uncharacterized repeat protein (TIGR01451 family)